MQNIKKIIVMLIVFISIISIMLPIYASRYTTTVAELEDPNKKVFQDYLASAAQKASNGIYYNFNAQKTVNKDKSFDIFGYNDYIYNYDRKCCGCLSPGNHATATKYKVVSIIDVFSDGSVTTYSKNKVTKLNESNANTDKKKSALIEAKKLAYCAYKGKNQAASIDSKKKPNYKAMTRYFAFMLCEDKRRDAIGISSLLHPHTGDLNSNKKALYNEKIDKEAISAIEGNKFCYRARIVLMYATNWTAGSYGWGQNGMVFTGKVEETKGDLTIQKVDANNTKIKLSGVKFKITGPEYPTGKEFTTDKNGEIKLTNIKKGTYTITEISNPYYGYEATATTNVTVTANKKVTKTIKNKKSVSNLEIQKRDYDTNQIIATKNIQFRLKIKGTNDYVRLNNKNSITGSATVTKFATTKNANSATKLCTDASGKVKINNLLTKEYVIEEISVAGIYGYDTSHVYWNTNGSATIRNKTIPTIKLINNQSKTMCIYNVKQTGNLKIVKRDYDSGSVIKTENIQFRLKIKGTNNYVRLNGKNYIKGSAEITSLATTTDANKATKLYTDTSGIVELKNILTKDYEVEEVSVAEKYGYNTLHVYWNSDASATRIKADTTKPNITVARKKTKSVNIYNPKYTGNLKIVKVDKDSNTALKGVQFVLKNEAGTKYIRLNNLNNIIGTKTISLVSEVETLDKATRLETNEYGEIQLYNILNGKYTLEEVSVGNNENYELDGNYIYVNNSATPLGNSKSVIITVERKRSYATNPNGNTTDRLANGVYEIETGSNSKNTISLPVEGNSYKIDDGTALVSSPKNDSDSQKFYIAYNPDLNAYKIRNLQSNRVLAVGTDGTTVTIRNNTSSTNDKYLYWRLIKSDNYYILNSLSNSKLYLNVNNNSMRVTSNDSRPSSNNYKFKINSTISASKYTIKNRRKYIKLSGNVWEDVLQGKDSNENNFLSSNDIKLQGINVNYRDANNIYKTTQTDENGYYEFNKVLIDDLDKCYIEFEYDGEIYTTIKDKNELGQVDNSTAISGKIDEIKFFDSVTETSNNEEEDITVSEEEDTTDIFTEENPDNEGSTISEDDSIVSIEGADLSNAKVTLKYKKDNTKVIYKKNIIANTGENGDYPWIRDNMNYTGIDVNLIDGDENIIQTMKTTGENGEYKFENIENAGKKYYVEFYYDGVSYTGDANIEDNTISGNIKTIVMNNINIALVNNETGNLIKATTATSDGEYKFENVPVIFEDGTKIKDNYQIQYTYKEATYITTEPLNALTIDEDINNVDIIGTIYIEQNSSEYPWIAATYQETIELSNPAITGEDGKFNFDNVPISKAKEKNSNLTTFKDFKDSYYVDIEHDGDIYGKRILLKDTEEIEFKDNEGNSISLTELGDTSSIQTINIFGKVRKEDFNVWINDVNINNIVVKLIDGSDNGEVLEVRPDTNGEFAFQNVNVNFKYNLKDEEGNDIETIINLVDNYYIEFSYTGEETKKTYTTSDLYAYINESGDIKDYLDVDNISVKIKEGENDVTTINTDSNGIYNYSYKLNEGDIVTEESIKENYKIEFTYKGLTIKADIDDCEIDNENVEISGDITSIIIRNTEIIVSIKDKTNNTTLVSIAANEEGTFDFINQRISTNNLISNEYYIEATVKYDNTVLEVLNNIKELNKFEYLSLSGNISSAINQSDNSEENDDNGNNGGNNTSNEELKNIIVSLLDKNTKQPIHDTITNEDGDFSFSVSIPNGIDISNPDEFDYDRCIEALKEKYEVGFTYNNKNYTTITPIEKCELGKDNNDNYIIIISGNIVEDSELQNETTDSSNEDTSELNITQGTYTDTEQTIEHKIDYSKVNVKLLLSETDLSNIEVDETEEIGNIVTSSDVKNDGHYSFSNIDMEKINYYILKFEYTENDTTYTVTKKLSEVNYDYTEANIANTSKVREVSDSRTAVDNSYQYIDGTTDDNQSKVNNSFNVHYNLTRNETKDASAKSINVAKFESQLSENGQIRDLQQFNEYENYIINKITATTNESGYGILGGKSINEIRKNGTREIKNLNCGLKQREQVDLSISSDLENVIVSVNGYTNTYMYGNKKSYYKDADGNDVRGEEAEEKFRLDIKASKWNYFRNMYASDIEFTAEKTCKVLLTYSMTISNNSNSLSAKVNKLANYHNANYTIIKSATTLDALKGENSNENEIIKWTTEENVINGYKVGNTKNLNLSPIAARQSTTIYVQYELSNEAVVSILSGDLSLDNVTEIESYTTYYGNNTYYNTGDGTRTGIYASIDKNSAPGNAISGDKTTYEDDTMAAPVLTMRLYENERTIEGNVFEDTQTEESRNNKERLGDGKFTDEDRNVGNVTVELYEYDSNPEKLASVWAKEDLGDNYVGEKHDVEKLNQVVGKKIDAKIKTDSNGHYKISGIVPGKYVLKFTYGDGSVIYKKGTEVEKLDRANCYKSTIIKSDTIKAELEKDPRIPSMWYKTTENDTDRTSDAADDSEAYSKNINIENESEDKKINRSSIVDSAKIDYKSAYTAPMNIKFELVEEENYEDQTGTTTQSYVRIEENPDGTKQVETVLKYENKNIDFGIVERPKQDYSLEKEITNIKITLANGQVIIDGDPNSQNIKYVAWLQNTPYKRANTAKIEIDNELIKGATLEITYKIKAIDESELNYLSYNYYYYGIHHEGDEKPEVIKISKIIDYLDNNLTYVENSVTNNMLLTKLIKKVDNDGKEKMQIKIGDASEDATKYLSEEAIESAKKYNNILILESNDNNEWTYKTSTLLETSDSLEFDNHAEIIELESTTIPSQKNNMGDYVPEENPNIEDNPDTKYAGQTDYFSERAVIVSPTGENRNYIKYIIGTSALIILAGGILIIKRKVL